MTTLFIALSVVLLYTLSKSLFETQEQSLDRWITALVGMVDRTLPEAKLIYKISMAIALLFTIGFWSVSAYLDATYGLILGGMLAWTLLIADDLLTIAKLYLKVDEATKVVEVVEAVYETRPLRKVSNLLPIGIILVNLLGVLGVKKKKN